MKISLNHKACYDWNYLMRSYKNFVNINSIVLEVGASTKERTVELAQWCYKLIGVEYYPERKPSSFQNISYLTGDWQNLSQIIPKESIDILISSHVIEHIPDDLKALNETYAILKQGGVGIFNTPNRKRLLRAITEIVTGERRFPYWEHVREYTVDELTELLKCSLFKKFQIIPVCFGLHGGFFHFYSEKVPKRFRKFANFFEVHLFK